MVASQLLLLLLPLLHAISNAPWRALCALAAAEFIQLLPKKKEPQIPSPISFPLPIAYWIFLGYFSSSSRIFFPLGCRRYKKIGSCSRGANTTRRASCRVDSWLARLESPLCVVPINTASAVSHTGACTRTTGSIPCRLGRRCWIKDRRSGVGQTPNKKKGQIKQKKESGRFVSLFPYKRRTKKRKTLCIWQSHLNVKIFYLYTSAISKPSFQNTRTRELFQAYHLLSFFSLQSNHECRDRIEFSFLIPAGLFCDPFRPDVIMAQSMAAFWSSSCWYELNACFMAIRFISSLYIFPSLLRWRTWDQITNWPPTSACVWSASATSIDPAGRDRAKFELGYAQQWGGVVGDGRRRKKRLERKKENR